MKIKIAIFNNINMLFTYKSEIDLPLGQIVMVNFHNKEVIGIVIEESFDSYDGPIKPIEYVLPYKIPEQYIKFAKFLSSYNMNALGPVLKLIEPFSLKNILKSQRIKNTTLIEKEIALLSPYQEKVLSEVKGLISEQKKPLLLHGITGSGKTEVFLKFIETFITDTSQFLLLVPEIALSTELAQKVEKRAGIQTFIWHNSVTPSKKLTIWKKAINGEKIVVVGARSALFIPFLNLKAIIIDEEHDQSYKQDEAPFYNARDMSVALAQFSNIPIILSSATPSVETYHNAMQKKYHYVKMSQRFSEMAFLPAMVTCDMKKENNIFNDYTISEIKKRLLQNKQTLIFINRRGFSSRILCNNCGKKVLCPGCSAWLSFHAHENSLVCHYCGFKTPLKKVCDSCGEELISIGFGVEKCEAEVKRIFPDARVQYLSSDNMNTPNKINETIELIKNNKIDIIIGTQIIAKGHNFPDLDLAVILCIDDMFFGDDFRVRERAFQLIHQVSGRVGREKTEDALIILQTFDPNDEFLTMISDPKNDSSVFYESELCMRKKTLTPPFSKLAAIIISSFDEEDLISFAKKLRGAAPYSDTIKVYGPIPALIYKLRSRYRIRFLISGEKLLQQYISIWLNNLKIPSKIRISVDIDPYNFS